ncbi:hypothetical protein DKX38_021416 [Salix brachista]|uniref:NnrU domain-containing protein n=1 Tax=Salix brachista TaxID=2182728 RepID=A0A5N5K7L8_9ROSI|nr:hypothetical protein DKX38_021416 [Salix brachista]
MLTKPLCPITTETPSPRICSDMASSLLLSNPFLTSPHHPSNLTRRQQPLTLKPTSALTLLNLTKPSDNNYPKFLKPTLPFLGLKKFTTRISTRDADTDTSVPPPLVGEDSAAFELGKQKLSSWIYFSLVLGVVLFVLDVAWIDNTTGFGKDFISAVSLLSESHEGAYVSLRLYMYIYSTDVASYQRLRCDQQEVYDSALVAIFCLQAGHFKVVMFILILIFATVHSGLASLRDMGEKLIGERAFRVLFAGVSLPLAVSTVVYFINHRYDGIQLWQLQSAPAVHQLVWISNFISFIFLYPSTFNLLEVAAVDKPKMHLWETGIMRITRHPQMVGQVMWCLAHTVWIGNSVAVAASLGLIGHHLFGVWNGDRRLSTRYGEAFESVKSRTSVVPFAAILDGRQKLPQDYYKEFLRLPYLSITALTLGAYFAHPLMQAASFRLHW